MRNVNPVKFFLGGIPIIILFFCLHRKIVYFCCQNVTNFFNINS